MNTSNLTTSDRRAPATFSLVAFLAVLLGIQFHASSVLAGAGSLDPTFIVGTGTNNRIFAMVAQSDGKLVIGGAFTMYNGSTRNRIARVERTGALDATFTIGSGLNGQVNVLALAPDGKILLGGQFTTVSGASSNRIARLNTNGSRDLSFVVGTGFNTAVTMLAVQADGKVLVGGAFTSYNGSACSRTVRLNADGSLDATFDTGTGPNGEVFCGTLRSDGSLLIAGSFSSVNGTSRAGIACLLANGAVDTSFDPGLGFNNAVYGVALQPDGRILAGGVFTSFNGSVPCARIARLNSDGSYDTGFNPGIGFNSWVYAIAVQADGMIVCGGNFTSVNATSRRRIARLNADGSVDNTFIVGNACNNWVYALHCNPEGKVTVAGGFTAYDGTPLNRLMRLDAGCDKELRLTLSTDGNGAQTGWELLPVGYTYVVNSGSGLPNNTDVLAITCVPSGCFRLRITDSAGDGMSTGGFVLRDVNDARIIDNTNDGVFGSESAISGAQGFCLPLGIDRTMTPHCDKLDWEQGDFIIASVNGAVNSQWAVGDQTDDGYEFWFFDPDGTYSQRKFRNHATSSGYGTGAARAQYLRLNWATNPLPVQVLLNVRIRGRVNGMNAEWGPACRFKVDPMAAACPATYLVNNPSSPNFSCGVTRARTGHVSAQPVTGANRYEFEFTNTVDSYLRLVRSNNYIRTLGFNTNPLVAGRTYDVRVRASKTGGTTWCPWGPVCTVTISSSMSGGDQRMELEEPAHDLTIWPVPNSGETMDMRLGDLPADEVNLHVMVYDATGRQVHQFSQLVAGPEWQGSISFDQHLVTGTYLMQVVAGEQRWTRRFVVAD